MQVNDLKRSALMTALAVTEGHINDLTVAWLQLKGATSTQINGAWVQLFAATLLGSATGNFNTDAYAYLGSLGHTGAINERWFSFWSGVLP